MKPINWQKPSRSRNAAPGHSSYRPRHYQDAPMNNKEFWVVGEHYDGTLSVLAQADTYTAPQQLVAQHLLDRYRWARVTIEKPGGDAPSRNDIRRRRTAYHPNDRQPTTTGTQRPRRPTIQVKSRHKEAIKLLGPKGAYEDYCRRVQRQQLTPVVRTTFYRYRQELFPGSGRSGPASKPGNEPAPKKRRRRRVSPDTGTEARAGTAAAREPAAVPS